MGSVMLSKILGLNKISYFDVFLFALISHSKTKESSNPQMT